MRQLDSGTDDSDLVSTSESESDDQEMVSEADDQKENGDAGDVEMVSTSGEASSLGLACKCSVCVQILDSTYAVHIVLHVFVAEVVRVKICCLPEQPVR